MLPTEFADFLESRTMAMFGVMENKVFAGRSVRDGWVSVFLGSSCLSLWYMEYYSKMGVNLGGHGL